MIFWQTIRSKVSMQHERYILKYTSSVKHHARAKRQVSILKRERLKLWFKVIQCSSFQALASVFSDVQMARRPGRANIIA